MDVWVGGSRSRVQTTRAWQPRKETGDGLLMLQNDSLAACLLNRAVRGRMGGWIGGDVRGVCVCARVLVRVGGTVGGLSRREPTVL